MSEWIYDPTAGRCRKTDGGQAVSEDKIAEIRERWAEFESLDHQSQVWDAHLYMRRAHNDRATLLAEVDRQRAEIERLKREPELLRAELISLANAARKALADAYDRAKEVRDAFQRQGP